MSAISPREPWPGYADLDESAREDLLAKKFQQAKDQNDQDYALALAAAVANYELVLDLQPDTTTSAPVAARAAGLHDDAGSWMGS
jgi:hypothetical protein